jgi:two-component system response regulator HydG
VEKILVVDDQRNMRTTLAIMLRGAGYVVDEAADGEKGAELGAAGAYDLVITDLRMGASSGIDVLRAVKKSFALTEVIVMTAYGTIESAVEAMRLGAHDYIQKPFTEQELLMKVDRALAKRRLAGQVQLLTSEFKEKYKFENIIGRSEAIRAVLGRIVRVAATDATVLITGESGTGKELVAKAIHANSPRADKPFVVVNSGSMPADLLESNLFGHIRGAFTGAVASKKGLFEVADGGSIFFDEIGNIGVDVQAKLLRVIQEREFMRLGSVETVKVDVRLIAATNADLKRLVGERAFREDLYYRINVISIALPPLRSKPDDIPLLTQYFLDKYGAENARENLEISDEALELLKRHSWPGNVRELENAIERAVVLAPPSGKIDAELIREYIEPSSRDLPTPSISVPPEGLPMKDVVQEFQKQLIIDALRKTSWVQKEAAKLLDVKPTTLNEMIKRHGIREDGAQ